VAAFCFAKKRGEAMEEIVFVHSVDCRVCVLELRDAPKKKLEKIIEERNRSRKCKDCERLQKIENRSGK
jgi:hypothetical protein